MANENLLVMVGRMGTQHTGVHTILGSVNIELDEVIEMHTALNRGIERSRVCYVAIISYILH